MAYIIIAQGTEKLLEGQRSEKMKNMAKETTSIGKIGLTPISLDLTLKPRQIFSPLSYDSDHKAIESHKEGPMILPNKEYDSTFWQGCNIEGVKDIRFSKYTQSSKNLNCAGPN